MKEHPILFSGPMVRAILEGRKTQTRRCVKPRNNNFIFVGWGDSFVLEPENRDWALSECRYKVGDTLWVRETWAKVCNSKDGQCYGQECLECGFEYRADKPEAKWAGDWGNAFAGNEVPDGCKWKPSIFMPRAACRIRLKVEGVCVERLYQMNEHDCFLEGIEQVGEIDGNIIYKDYEARCAGFADPHISYFSLWDSINGENSRHKNPWVWVITFKVI